MAGFFDETDDFDNYSDTNNSSFDPEQFAGVDNSSTNLFASDNSVTGAGPNTIPTVSDKPQSSVDSPYAGIGNILGSIGSTIQNLPNIARAAGTAVGTAQHNISTAGATYSQAQQSAASGNSLGTWWQYASTTDKLMIGLAVVGIIVALKESK